MNEQAEQAAGGASGQNPASAQPQPGHFKPPTKDPWKALRGVMAGTMILEAIIVLLALPVVAKVGGGITVVSGAYIIGLAVLLVAGCGIQRRSWALGYDLVLQALAIAAWFIHPALGICGLIFAAVWAYILYLRRDMKDRQDHGLLPGQRD